MEQRLIIGYTQGKLMHTAAKKKRGANYPICCDWKTDSDELDFVGFVV